MPIYEYQCDECGALYEVFQKMSDDPLTECEKCGGSLRKVLHPVAIHFKGSGFYTTDYGKGSGRPAGTKDAGADGTSTGESASSSAGDKSSSDGDSAKAGNKPAKGEAHKAREKQKAS